MTKIGFLGFGKIGKAIYHEICEKQLGEVVFIQCLADSGEQLEGITYLTEYNEKYYREADLIIECATATALEKNIDHILENCDLLMFSLTAFSNYEFENNCSMLVQKYHHHIYIPHGAILGLDGIMDGSKIWESVTIETTKNPASLGRNDKVRTVLYEGSTRGACREYPRNVNVHAAVAITGIGFDKTRSKIIADPEVNSNTHLIHLKGVGVDMNISVSSFSEGGVTGKYTPLSACGSIRRILQDTAIKIV